MSDIAQTSNAIQAVKHWILKLVIDLNFCPFAKKVFDQGKIRFVECDKMNTESILEKVIEECVYLDEHEQTETTLIVFSKALEDFDTYLHVAEVADELLKLQGYEGVYQLATFHPDYVFENTDELDAANYTNRSPYPVIHLIREKTVEKVLQSFPGPETIPENNIRLAREKGTQYFSSLLIEIKSGR